MSKEDIVAAAKERFKAGLDQLVGDVVGEACDKQAQETMGSVDVNALVAAQKAADEQASAAALDQAHAEAQASLDALKAEQDASLAKLNADESIINGMKDSMDKFQASLDALKALFPVPVAPEA